MSLHHDLTFWLAVAALILAFPISMGANIVTPIFVNWAARRSYQSLVKRIALLESRLSELEKIPAISETENEILWGLTQASITTYGAANGVILIVSLGIIVLSDANHIIIKGFEWTVMIVLVGNLLLQVRLRHQRNFRLIRSPRARENLKKEIQELRAIKDLWPENH